jgi:hypothetical protein
MPLFMGLLQLSNTLAWMGCGWVAVMLKLICGDIRFTTSLSVQLALLPCARGCSALRLRLDAVAPLPTNERILTVLVTPPSNTSCSVPL